MSILLVMWGSYGILPLVVASGNGQYADEDVNCCRLFSLMGIIFLFQTFTDVIIVLIVLGCTAIAVAIVIGCAYLIIKIENIAGLIENGRTDP